MSLHAQITKHMCTKHIHIGGKGGVGGLVLVYECGITL